MESILEEAGYASFKSIVTVLVIMKNLPILSWINKHIGVYQSVN